MDKKSKKFICYIFVFLFVLSFLNLSLALPPTPTFTPSVLNTGDLRDFFVTNGEVYAVTANANTVYIGGNFTLVGPHTGSGVPIKESDGLPVSGFPKVNGTIYSVISDGNGGWYIGGDFTYVAGIERNRVAHIFSNGSLDPDWNPDSNNTVRTLVLSGGVVYAGGFFTDIGEQTRNRIADKDIGRRYDNTR